MSSIEERIAEVLARHTYVSGFETNCSCRHPGIFDWTDYRPHLAAVLVETLGLRRQAYTLPDWVVDVPCTCVGTPCHAIQNCDFSAHIEWRNKFRYVTEWTTGHAEAKR